MRVVECEQGSAEWLACRVGRVTASEIADAGRFYARGEKKGGETKTRLDYKLALIGELMTGKASETFVSRWMERGTEYEPEARAAYEMKNDVLVRRVGFIIHPTIDRSGASPDGLVGECGGLEIKVPKLETHLRYLRAGVLPPEYEPQLMWNIECSERDWWDFLSYSPELAITSPEHSQFKVRTYRNEERQKQLRDGALQLLAEVDEMMVQMGMKPPAVTFKQQLEQSLVAVPVQVQDGITDDDVNWWRKQAGWDDEEIADKA